MRYWWVNQGQTHRHELEGGYLWSPKRQKNQARSQYYENMKAVAPGDVVFCYWDAELRAQGTLRSFGYDAPKPEEFGHAGRNWSKIGYRADVEFNRLVSPVRPRDYWQQIRALLPDRYSPLDRSKGTGSQSVYLADLPPALGNLLTELIARRGNPIRVADVQAPQVVSRERIERELWENEELLQLDAAPISSTDREALVYARRGQGTFRRNVASVERACRITRIDNADYLIASHIKPWRHASNEERLSRDNGLMLAPHADFLFDRGFISFGEGRVLVSKRADPKSLLKLGVDPEKIVEAGGFSDRQEQFLEFHRREIFRRAM